MFLKKDASSSNFDMRQQVVSLTGIMDVTSFREEVTRGDFARMLVNASSYRDNLRTVAVSVFAEVLRVLNSHKNKEKLVNVLQYSA